jgi:hypothetical protein
MGDGLDDIGIEKRNSLGRTQARFSGRRPVPGYNRMSGVEQGKRDSVGSLGGYEDGSGGGRMGVSLTDKPMDD